MTSRPSPDRKAIVLPFRAAQPPAVALGQRARSRSAECILSYYSCQRKPIIPVGKAKPSGERPLALSADELEAVARAHERAPGDVMLGFTRRFAPLVGEIERHFRDLSLTRDGGTRKLRSANQDKGFEEEMRRFLAAVRSGGPAPIPFDQSAATTRATLAALSSLRSEQPQPV